MTRITSELLLANGLPKSTRLQDIKTLNLSKMQIKTQDLDPELFSQMKSLEELNLSENMLSDFPNGLKLPNLKVLNCADNQLEDVTLFEQLPALEELSYEGNMYMMISDDYKVMCLLPNLRRLNGKEITSSANHVRVVNSRELTNRVSAYWEKNYKDRLPQRPSATRVNSVKIDFINSAVMHVKYGPNSLQDFTKWRVKMIAEKLLASLVEPKEDVGARQEEEADDENAGIARKAAKSPRKREGVDNTACISDESSSKKLRLRSDSAAASPLRPRRLPNSPRNPGSPSPNRPREAKSALVTRDTPKRGSCQDTPKRGSCQDTPKRSSTQDTPKRSGQDTPKKSSRQDTPKKSSRQDTPKKSSTQDTPKKSSTQDTSKMDNSRDTPKKSKTTGSSDQEKQSPKLQDSQQKDFDLEPLHFLQCHSKDNSPKDFSTQLWSCAFEPSLDYCSGEGPRSSSTVATCGGESVCVIDCKTGHVLKKYKVSGEEFFTLAWTSLTMVTSDQQKRKFNVLAAAGRKGVVKLIHSKANFCYGEFKAHKKPISTICFSSKQETFLFNLENKRNVSVGGPSKPSLLSIYSILRLYFPCY